MVSEVVLVDGFYYPFRLNYLANITVMSLFLLQDINFFNVQTVVRLILGGLDSTKNTPIVILAN